MISEASAAFTTDRDTELFNSFNHKTGTPAFHQHSLSANSPARGKHPSPWPLATSLCGTTVANRKPQKRKLDLSLTTAAQILALPAALLIGLPVGLLESARLAIGPRRTRCTKRLVIIAVEDEDNALIRRTIRRHRRAIDEKAHRGCVGIGVVHRQHHRLVPGIGIAPCAVRQKRIVAEGP